MSNLMTALPPDVEQDLAEFMKDYFAVDAAGRVIGTHHLTMRAFIAMKERGDQVYEGKADPETQWFDGVALANRPESAVVLDGVVLRHIRAPATVLVDGQRYICDEAELELVFAYPGRSRVSIECWPDKIKRFEIDNENSG